MTVEQVQAGIERMEELMKEASEALRNLGPDRIDDIRYEIDMIDQSL